MLSHRFVWSVVCYLTALSTVAQAEFPVAGANPQRSGHVDAMGPMSPPEVAWERGLGVHGISDTQPVIDQQGNLYVTGCPVNQKSWTFDADPRGTLVSLTPDGEVRWRYDWTWRADRQNTWSQLTGPVLVADNLVVMGSRFGWLRCWNRETGELQWERKLSPGTEPITSTPVADDAGYVYVHVRDIPTLRKIDARTGQYVWVHKFHDGTKGTTSSPTLSHDQQTAYIGRTARGVAYLYAINTADGSFKWAWSPEVSSGHSFAWGIPVVDRNGTVYIQDEEFAHLYAVRDLNKLHAFSWSYKREGKGSPRLMAVDHDAVYSSFNKPQTFLFSLTHDGQERWTRTLSEGRGTAGIVAGNGAIYFGINGTGNVYALSTETGDILWTKQVGTPDAGFSEGLTLGTNGVLYVPVTETPDHPDEPTIVALQAP
ncbi:MAG: PQQ-like beta-propeller repeat protein [Planctomycetaceae bacterium]|nr:PQQ-like beta-propeller repeat protein [Planctomycetaceae bacterium]